MKFAKRILFFIVLGTILLTPIITQAAWYSSSYDFKGGVYSSSFQVNKGKKVQVSTYPTKWPKEKFRIDLYLERYDSSKKKWYSVSQSWNYSYKNDTCTAMKATTSAKHRIYMRSSSLPNNQPYKGSVKIQYNF